MLLNDILSAISDTDVRLVPVHTDVLGHHDPVRDGTMLDCKQVGFGFSKPHDVGSWNNCGRDSRSNWRYIAYRPLTVTRHEAFRQKSAVDIHRRAGNYRWTLGLCIETNLPCKQGAGCQPHFSSRLLSFMRIIPWKSGG